MSRRSLNMNSTIIFADTGFYADTVEWCPHGDFQDLFVCGTYQLLEQLSQADLKSNECVDDALDKSSIVSVSDTSKPKRVGNVQLYSYKHIDDACNTETESCLKKLQCLETAGILDTKWCCGSSTHPVILGCVTSEGEFKTYGVERKDDVESTVLLGERSTFVTDVNKLCLSLDWASLCHDRIPEVVISDSAGGLTLLRCKQGSFEVEQVLQWTGHQYESWIAAFDRWTPNVIYSGGDDCLLKGWDTRQGCSQPVFTCRRHSMGVSSIQCNPVHEYIMATGSYDESILVWDTRAMKIPLCTGSPGGGVWRIKWHPSTGDFILTASMYEGFHILKFDRQTGKETLELITSYNERTSLAYGADWRPRLEVATLCSSFDNIHLNEPPSNSSNEDNYSENKKAVAAKEMITDVIATCSFYDHTLHLWKVIL